MKPFLWQTLKHHVVQAPGKGFIPKTFSNDLEFWQRAWQSKGDALNHVISNPEITVILILVALCSPRRALKYNLLFPESVCRPDRDDVFFFS